MPRPPSTAVDDRGEVVVGEDHVGGFLRHLGAGDPHRDADVRALERRRVVDAVAGHRDDVALALQHRRRAAPCPPARRGRRRRSRRPARRARRRESAANSVPGSARPSMPSCAAIAAAVVAWSPVIMRTRIPASLQQGDRVPRLLARRIDDGDERQQRQALHLVEQGRRRGRRRPGRCRARRRPARAGPRRRGGRSRRGRGRGRSSMETVAPSASRTCDERASRTSGAPLTKQRTTFRPSSSISWKVAMSLYSESNGTSATRG